MASFGTMALGRDVIIRDSAAMPTSKLAVGLGRESHWLRLPCGAVLAGGRCNSSSALVVLCLEYRARCSTPRLKPNLMPLLNLRH